MIQVKNTDVLLSLSTVAAHPALQDVMAWICDKYPNLICITEGFRPGPGCHGTDPCRARDIRSTVFQEPRAIESEINNFWEYDPDRPHKLVAMYHRILKPSGKWGAYHFHIQTHPSTRPRTA